MLDYRGSVRDRYGPLAHLVERSHGMGKVSGSSPLWSTLDLDDFKKLRSGG